MRSRERRSALGTGTVQFLPRHALSDSCSGLNLCHAGLCCEGLSRSRSRGDATSAKPVELYLACRASGLSLGSAALAGLPRIGRTERRNSRPPSPRRRQRQCVQPNDPGSTEGSGQRISQGSRDTAWRGFQAQAVDSASRESRQAVPAIRRRVVGVGRGSHRPQTRRTRPSGLHAVRAGRPKLLAAIRTPDRRRLPARKDWPSLESLAERYLALSPATPEIRYRAAVATINQGKTDIAEKMAMEMLARGEADEWPRIHVILGLVRENRSEFGRAAESYRAFLKAAPNAPLANTVRNQLADLEAR